MQRILLDTDAYSAYRRGDSRVLDALAEANRVYLSVFVLGELFYGFKGGSRESKNRRELAAFLKKPTVRLAHTTNDTANFFCEIKHGLRRKGNLIPINDLWIAAHNFELGTFLTTYDSHFLAVEGLKTWPFLKP